MLFACNTGKEGRNKPAQIIANTSGKIVWAPKSVLYYHPALDLFYVNDYKLEDPRDNRICDREFQENMWKCFIPNNQERS